MGQSKYRKALNNALLYLANNAQPLFEKYQEVCSGPRNNYVNEKAKRYIEKITAVRERAIEMAGGAYEGYLERLDKKAKSISGKDIDKADIVLLESSLYVLNQEEFDVLQDKYEGNRSMERILSGYAKKHSDTAVDKNDRIDLKKGLYCRFMTDEEKKALAKRLYKECLGWIKNDDGYAVADYVVSMAGDMFGGADCLKE